MAVNKSKYTLFSYKQITLWCQSNLAGNKYTKIKTCSTCTSAIILSLPDIEIRVFSCIFNVQLFFTMLLCVAILKTHSSFPKRHVESTMCLQYLPSCKVEETTGWSHKTNLVEPKLPEVAIYVFSHAIYVVIFTLMSQLVIPPRSSEASNNRTSVPFWDRLGSKDLRSV